MDPAGIDLLKPDVTRRYVPRTRVLLACEGPAGLLPIPFKNIEAGFAEFVAMRLETGQEDQVACVRLDVVAMFTDIGAARRLVVGTA
jgi:hypothetical protein